MKLHPSRGQEKVKGPSTPKRHYICGGCIRTPLAPSPLQMYWERVGLRTQYDSVWGKYDHNARLRRRVGFRE